MNDDDSSGRPALSPPPPEMGGGSDMRIGRSAMSGFVRDYWPYAAVNGGVLMTLWALVHRLRRVRNGHQQRGPVGTA